MDQRKWPSSMIIFEAKMENMMVVMNKKRRWWRWGGAIAVLSCLNAQQDSREEGANGESLMKFEHIQEEIINLVWGAKKE
ncbi:hypothetical protein Leryth_012214 [Lithospermum erythrorhizon]|nr:hypothetical protein Leryth_012214 [Lithospermum erythrorhizon]